MRKKTVECSLGIRTTEETARRVDALVRELPKDRAYEYRRKATPTADTEVLPEQRVDVSRITSRAMDRDRDIVLPEGMELDEYRQNPIVLFQHDYMKPIGKSLWIKADADGLISKTQYAVRPAKFVGEWLPDMVWGLVQAEVLRGKSIGFQPLEVREPTPEELAVYPEAECVISKSLLMEYSVVSVPCNPEALVESVGKGLTVWAWKTIGRVKPKGKARPPLDHRALTDQLAAVHLDPQRIADQAVRNLLARWEV